MGSLIVSSTFYIPESILVEILSRLPVKSLLRFKCVDKLWYNMISSTKFVSMHLNNYASTYLLVNCHDDHDRRFIALFSPTTDTNLSPMDIQLPAPIHSSSNGIVCLRGWLDQIALWNPATSEFKVLRPSNISLPSFPATIHLAEVGFGFDPITNDYKVLQIVHVGLYVDQFELYSLRSDSWKKLESTNNVRRIYDWRGAISLSIKGKNTLCWITIPVDIYDIWEIVSFDLSREEFDFIQLPPSIATLAEDHNGMLFPFKDSIALICRPYMSYHPRTGFYDVWVCENFSTSVSNNSWIKLWSIIASPFKNFPNGFSGNGQLIFFDDDDNVILYDLLTNVGIKHPGCGNLILDRAFEYKESLVAISELRK